MLVILIKFLIEKYFNEIVLILKILIWKNLLIQNSVEEEKFKIKDSTLYSE